DEGYGYYINYKSTMKKLLIIVPHLSTGGCPQVTLNKVELLKNVIAGETTICQSSSQRSSCLGRPLSSSATSMSIGYDYARTMYY
ncbi:MAG: hypothetical protein ACK53Y_11940, partial [bacterium]